MYWIMPPRSSTKKAMAQLRTTQARASSMPVMQYAPIARALLMLSETECIRMKRKFDISYLMAKEGIPFEKLVSLCGLESYHEFDIGHSYRNAPSAKLFTH